ncbi:hypothetical protein BH11MYX2_BH11MYX2_41340 [soil metagenome]
MSVQLDTQAPRHFERSQLALRVVVGIVFGWFGITLGGVTCLLYVLLPVVVAGAITTGGVKYARDVAPQLWSVIAWIVRCEAYMMLLVDRLPMADEPGVQLAIRFTGTPTVASALVRLVTSLPSTCVLAVLFMFSVPMWVIAAVLVLVGGQVPAPILAYQRGVLRWQLRLLAYHASLVVEYPLWTMHEPALREVIAR